MKVTSTVDIEAPADIIWTATKDVEDWPSWSPNFEQVQLLGTGGLCIGEMARIKQPGLPATDWCVTEYAERERFKWNTTVLGLRMVATHEISAVESGTRNVLELEVSGLLSVLLWPVLKPALTFGLRRENEALRRRCLAGRNFRQ